MRRRIVITGMGAVTPLGHSVQELYDGQIAGRNGVDRIQLFDASTFPTTFAAQVKDFDLAKFTGQTDRYKNSGVNSRFAAAASTQAMDDAGLADLKGVDPTRFGIYLGAGEGIQDFFHLISLIGASVGEDSRQIDQSKFLTGGLKYFHADQEFEQELHTTAGHLADHFGLEGPNYNCLTACAASSQAIGEACEMIRRGETDVMLSGGSHSMIHPLGVTGFNRLTALSTNNDAPQKASRPFDLLRDGFVLGEGAGILILEDEEHAKRRGANIHAEVMGYGSTGDAFRMTDSHPDGRGAIACMEGALRTAALAPTDIGYINAHGTSTPVNDKVETEAIKRIFGDAAYKTPVSSSKSMLGHLIAAAGAVELITSVMVIKHAVLPPTINYEVPDPECDLDYIPNEAREKTVDHVLSNSFGFGGQNISLVASRY